MTDTPTLEGRGAATVAARADATDLVAEILWDHVYGRDRYDIGKARSAALRVVQALRREGLLTGTKAVDGSEVIAAVVSRAAEKGETPARGISHLVAEALVLLDLPQVHRDVIASLMPDLDTRTSSSTVAMQIKRALRRFYNWDWIDRTEDGLITVKDQAGLIEWFSVAADLNERRAQTTLDLAKAVAAINARVAAGDDGDLRRVELLRLRRLMGSAPGSVTNARGTRRVVPRSNTI